jgi:hypothetical protein
LERESRLIELRQMANQFIELQTAKEILGEIFRE